ncbi:hypothetical protein QYM36_004319, partial [Artemia franciscana]
AAAKYHSLRVYCQVQIWLGNPVDPLRLGWKLQDNEVFAPIKTDLPAAPSQLLKIIKCSCRIDGCDSEKCTCKKNGLECTIACRELERWTLEQVNNIEIDMRGIPFSGLCKQTARASDPAEIQQTIEETTPEKAK